jgi:hypothetical protein
MGIQIQGCISRKYVNILYLDYKIKVIYSNTMWEKTVDDAHGRYVHSGPLKTDHTKL